MTTVDKSDIIYNDYNINAYTTYYYQMRAIDNSNNISDRTPQVSTTTLHIDNNENIPSFNLEQNSPNPFNPTTTIGYTLAKDSDVTIKVFDISGNLVATLFRDYQIQGYHSVTWDGTNDSQVYLGGGIYFYQIIARDFIRTKKMILIK